MDKRLLHRLERVASRFRSVRMWRSLAAVWLVLALVAAVLLWMKTQGAWPQWISAWFLAAVAAVLVAVVVAVVRASFRDAPSIAQRVESTFPDLRQRLVTAIAQRPQKPDGQLGFLQQTVVDETLQHAALRPWPEKTVPPERIASARLLNVCALVFLALVVVALMFSKGPSELAAESSQTHTPTGGEIQVTVKPGDAEVERGTNLIVVARFAGAVPAEVQLVAEHGDERLTVPMTRSLDDPLFGGSLQEVATDLTYHVEYAGEQSDRYQVTVFEYPALLRSDARISYPGYTQLTNKLVEDTRRVTVVEGSTLTWICHLNKPVISAALIDKQGNSTYLEPDSSAPSAYAASILLTESRRWRLQLVDDAERTNQHPVELIAKVIPNQRPELKLAMARDVRVSPLEELTVAASFRDDYGLKEYGLAYSIGGDQPTDVVLGAATMRKERRSVDHLLALETMDAQPDDLLSYHFWAEDFGPDGKPRRTFSDMYFAEVRHFEEIFRQGQQPPGGQQQQQQQQQAGQNAQQAEQLAELQKQIINGTWNVMRRETSGELTDQFTDDVTLLVESQSTALEQVDELAARLDDELSTQYSAEIRKHMEEAIKQLSTAVDDASVASLQPALAAEQASYQALLKLRAREHEVVRGQQQGSSGGSSAGASRSREQLQALELDNEQNRYETERQAQSDDSPQQEQQREVRQVLNRLRELARRQEDLNKQLKQLQTALEEAETEEEREEIRRQLKRLRDQQQQLLRDTDELADRMDQSQNDDQMQQSREQLDETRENVRQASESLAENDVSQALSAGTRAEREFKRMRDDFRREAAHQFSEEMREMREQSRQLDEQQQELGERMTDLSRESSGSLRSPNSRDRLHEEFEQQQQALDNLLQRMQETVEQAETSEPLLAEKLYDSYRETKQRKVEDNLELAGELLRRGFDPQARQIEESAREGISDLRQDIEQAAESVLGDETEGLRRALGELDELVRSLEQEVERADPSGQRGEQANGQSAQQDTAQSNEDGDRSNQPDRERQDRAQQQNGQQQQQEQDASDSPRPDQSEQAGNREGQPGQRGDAQQTSDEPSRESGPDIDPFDQNREPGQSQSDSQQPLSEQPNGQGQSSGQSDQLGRDEDQQPGQDRGRRNRGDLRQRASQYDSGGGLEQFANDSLGSAPLTGDNFREWSDRLRDVEEMVEEAELRSEAARIRDRARSIRVDYKRNAKEPQWDDVRKLVAEPLKELRQRVAEELMRRSAERTALVPIDRDAVPAEFAEQVRRYYEQLGSGN